MALVFSNCSEAFSQTEFLTHRELAGSIIPKMRLSEESKTNRLIEATVNYLDGLEEFLNEGLLLWKE